MNCLQPYSYALGPEINGCDKNRFPQSQSLTGWGVGQLALLEPLYSPKATWAADHTPVVAVLHSDGEFASRVARQIPAAISEAPLPEN